MMRNKSGIAFVLAIIFTLLSLSFAIACVEGIVWSEEIKQAEVEKEANGGDEKDDIGIEGIFALMVYSIGFAIAVIHLFFWSFGGVVASEVNYNAADVRVRRASRIMLGINGTLMASSVVFFFCSVLYG